jgi:hypothetical protein
LTTVKFLARDSLFETITPDAFRFIAGPYNSPEDRSIRIHRRLDRLDSLFYGIAAARAIRDIWVGYVQGLSTTSLWIRHLFDARYVQQGFYLGDPAELPNQSFLQQGDPRQVGIT